MAGRYQKISANDPDRCNCFCMRRHYGDGGRRIRLLATISTLMLYLAAISAGCSHSDSDPKLQYLVRAGNSVATVEDFKKAYEVAVSSYPADMVCRSEYVKDIKTEVLNQLTDDVLIKERASELGIEISEEELSRASAEIRKDYPDDEFEDMLLTNAVSYNAWMNRLKQRLLTDKVVEKDLEDTIQITAEDISDYNKRCGEYAQEESGSESDESQDRLKKTIRLLRREKSEALYTVWISQLQQKYGVDINQELWEKLSRP